MHEGLGMRLSLSSDLSAIHLHEISSHDQEMFMLSGIPSVEWVARYKIILTLRCCCCLGGDESGDGPAYMVRKVKNLHLLGSYSHYQSTVKAKLLHALSNYLVTTIA